MSTATIFSTNNNNNNKQLAAHLPEHQQANFVAQHQPQHHHHHHHHHLHSSQHQQVSPSTMLSGKAHLPIDDFNLLPEPDKYSDAEKQLRIKLTSVYRLIELNGWSMGIYNHITAKLSAVDKQQSLGAESNSQLHSHSLGHHHHDHHDDHRRHHSNHSNQHDDDGSDKLLIHPFGLHYNEITASSMLKIDLKSGAILDNGSTNFELNWPGYIIHSAVHLARPDLKCIIHLHYAPVAAASAHALGLLPICQEQALLGEIKYFDYTGILTEAEERDAVAKAFGSTCKVMILRNHGLIVAGESVQEAYYNLQNLMRACEAQARLLAAGGLENIVRMTPEAAHQAWLTVQQSRYPIRMINKQTLAAATQPPNSNSNSNSSQANTANSDATAKRPSPIKAAPSDDSEIDSDLESGESMSVSSRCSSIVSDDVDSLADQGANAANLHRHQQAQTCIRPQPKSKLLMHQLPVSGYVTMFDLDFEAQLRQLDLAGHKTGYNYRRPLVRFYRQLQ